MSLMESFRNVLDKNKIGKEGSFIPAIPTGIDLFDYRNGRYHAGAYSIGIEGGIFYICGKSGGGKTTFGVQMATSIVDQYADSQVIHFDYERATSMARVKQLTGWKHSRYKEKYMLLNENITAESLFRMVQEVSKVKKERYEEIKIDSGEVDENGKTIYIYPPTVMLVDSLALMIPEKLEDDDNDELGGGMNATAIAKVNAQIFKRINGPIKNCNIIIILINHITDLINTNPRQPKRQEINFLKQDESLPGGKTPIYLANCMIKMTPGAKLTSDSEYGINGFMVNVEFIKSRSNAAGQKMTLVYDQINGFNNILSNYNLLKEEKMIKGAGRGMYLESCPDVKFTQKQILEKYETNQAFRAAFDEAVGDKLVEYIPIPKEIEDEETMYEEEYEETASTQAKGKGKIPAVEEPEDEGVQLEYDEETGLYKGTDGQFYEENDQGEYVVVEL